MKKITLLFIIFLMSSVLIACQKTTTTVSTTTEPLAISDIVTALDNPLDIGLFITETPETSVGINFKMSSETNAYVEYAKDGITTFTKVDATKKTTTVGKKVVYLFEAEMSGLEQGESYSYRVSNEDASEVSDIYHFTMPSNTGDSFTFMYLADPQENAEIGYMAYAYSVLNVLEYSQADFDFVMSPGDFVDDADIKSEWDWFYQYSAFYITEKPLIATIGNHEVNGIGTDVVNNLEFDGYLNLPNNGPVYDAFDELEGDMRSSNFDDGKTYSFNYGNAHFIAIDTEMFCDGSTACTAYDHSNVEILKSWIQNDLESNDLTWTIVLLHRGPYGLSYDSASVRDNLIPIFDEFNVDLVLSGHDHQYSRSVYLENAMVPFQTSNLYSKGLITLIDSAVLNNNFNHYASSIGVTYVTGNTVSTKFYGGDKSSGIQVNYKFLDENPVIPFITVTADSIHVVSYGVSKDYALAIVPTGVYILEEFTITK
ncbi:MAG: metallophosphoesterase family protein [Candidatus Izemoplasmatales bacterium]|nr:metallophosphoesterase family protein [Candidatus Izemoplasmatales bacterium]